MYPLCQNIWLQYGFNSNPYDTCALTAYADSLLPISKAIVGRSLEEEESRMLTNILRGVGGARVVCEGEVGVGKTTFINYHRYLWEQESQDRLFTPMSEIPIQRHWTMREFLLTVLSNLINKILLVHGEKKVMNTPILKEILALTRVFFTYSYQLEGQILGSGVGGGKAEDVHVPFVPETQLLFYFRESIKEIIKLGYAGVFLHFENLELLNQRDTEKTKLLFQDIRDALQVSNVYYVFVAQSGFFSEVISPLERVRSIFYGFPIHIKPLSQEDVLEVLQRRYQLLSIQKGKYILPVKDDFVGYLYDLYRGKIRIIMDSLSQLVSFCCSGAVQTIDKETAYNLLRRLVQERLKQLLTPKEIEIVLHFSHQEKFTQRMIMDTFKIQRPNVISYTNHLLQTNSIYRTYEEGRTSYYRVNESFKILSNKEKSPSSKDSIKKSKRKDKEISLKGRQKKLFQYIEKKGSITTREYAEKAGVVHQTARSDIKEMMELGILEQEGKGRNTHYVMPKG